MDFKPYIKECERIWRVPLQHLAINLTIRPHKWDRRTIVGCCYPSKSMIELMPLPSYSETKILHILTHELAHYVDWHRNCEKWRTKRGRRCFHDNIFRAILCEVAKVCPDWVQNLRKRGVANQ